MARKVKIMQYATRRYDSQGEIAHAKTFQRGGGELTEQTLLGGIRGIHPVFKLKHTAFMGEITHTEIPCSPHTQQFLWRHVAEQLVCLLSRGFRA